MAAQIAVALMHPQCDNDFASSVRTFGLIEADSATTAYFEQQP